MDNPPPANLVAFARKELERGNIRRRHDSVQGEPQDSGTVIRSIQRVQRQPTLKTKRRATNLNTYFN